MATKLIRIAILCIILFFRMIFPVYADGTHPQGIKLDGTIGNAGKLDLPGPDSLKKSYLL